MHIRLELLSRTFEELEEILSEEAVICIVDVNDAPSEIEEFDASDSS